MEHSTLAAKESKSVEFSVLVIDSSASIKNIAHLTCTEDAPVNSNEVIVEQMKRLQTILMIQTVNLKLQIMKL